MTMNKVRFFVGALVAMLAVSCYNDTVDQPVTSTEDALIARKFVNTSASAKLGELIIYVDEQSAALLEGAEEATRCGVSEIETIAEEIGAVAIEPVFNMMVDAECKRARGMHRWYAVSFPADVDVEVVAKRFAAVKSIERVQFSTRVVRPKEQPVTPVDDATLAEITRSAALPFNDAMLPMQWHYYNSGDKNIFPTIEAGEDINVLPAWDITAGRPEVIVAIVDEGVCHSHEDLADNFHVNEAELNGVEGVDDDENGYIDDVYGYNFVADRGRIIWGRDGDSGHGTHVAGTVAAVNNNGIGVSGVAGGTGNGDGVRIFSSQIFSGRDELGVKGIAAAIEYAADRGASILQCSWGVNPGEIANDNAFESGSVQVEYEALQYFISKKNCAALDGGLVVFAAGNVGKPAAGYPGAYNDYIAVTAFAPDGLPAYYTCYDRGCNVAAPGGEYFWVSYPNRYGESGCVLSTIPADNNNRKYGYMQGTSMACPHVSGIAALALSYALDLGKTFTVDEFKALLLTSVNEIDSKLTGTKTNYGGGNLNLTSYKGKMGTGKIDAYRMLMAVRGTMSIPVPVGSEIVLDFNKYIGDGEVSLKVLSDYTISDETREKLGITSDSLFGGKLLLTCTKPGAGTINVAFVAGGTTEGGGMLTGGMRIEREFALIARESYSIGDSGMVEDANGWL